MSDEVTQADIDYPTVTPYENWMKAEGVPIVTGYSVEDLRDVTLKPWPRRGGSGAFLKLIGHGQTAGAYISKIPPGGSLEPHKHLYEETILVLSGQGATTVWTKDSPKQTFEWQEWSLFSIPLNAWYQHFNSKGNKPAKLFAVNTAPVVMNLFHNMDFIFNNDFVFKDRYAGEQDYFRSKGKPVTLKGRMLWESNFISNLPGVQLYEYKARGAGGSNLLLEMAGNSMAGHISEFPPGSYKKAHRHGPAANVVVLAGKGYSLMWTEGQPYVRCNWHNGSLVVPPDRWFHQHFNTSGEPARYVAIRPWGSRKYPSGQALRQDENVKAGGDQIEYADEDPEIMRLFKQELAKEGMKLQMSHPRA